MNIYIITGIERRMRDLFRMHSAPCGNVQLKSDKRSSLSSRSEKEPHTQSGELHLMLKEPESVSGLKAGFLVPTEKPEQRK